MSKDKAKGKKAEKISKRKAIKSAFDDKFGGDPIKQLDNLFGSIRKPVKKSDGGTERKRIQANVMAVKKAQQKTKNKAPKNLTTNQKKFLARERMKEVDRIQDLVEKEDRKRPGPPMKKSEADRIEKEVSGIKTGTIKEKTPSRAIKKERETDLQRLEKKKKEAAEFEKTLEKKKRNQTSKFGAFDTGAPQLEVRKSGPKMGALTGRRAKRTIKGDITKKMNMGGVMKARGGTFKGTF